MRQIEIEVPTDTLYAVFESNSISAGMTKDAPGGIHLQLLPMPMQKRHAEDAEKLFGSG